MMRGVSISPATAIQIAAGYGDRCGYIRTRLGKRVATAVVAGSAVIVIDAMAGACVAASYNFV